jgi:hypothetical protein
MVARFAASTTHGQLSAAKEAQPWSHALTTSSQLDTLTPRLTVWSREGALTWCFPIHQHHPQLEVPLRGISTAVGLTDTSLRLLQVVFATVNQQLHAWNLVEVEFKGQRGTSLLLAHATVSSGSVLAPGSPLAPEVPSSVPMDTVTLLAIIALVAGILWYAGRALHRPSHPTVMCRVPPSGRTP